MISLGKYFAYVQALCTILSLVVVIYIINKPDNPAYKLAWVVPILLFPIFGGVFYVAIAGNHASKHFVRKIEKSITDACRFLKQDEEVAEHLDSVSEIAGMQSKYIRDWGKYPVFQNTEVTTVGGAEEGKTIYFYGIFYYPGRTVLEFCSGDSGAEGEGRR